MIEKANEIITDLRKDRNLTQKEMAEILKVSNTTISGYETGAISMHAKSLINYALYFGVSVDYILGLSAQPMRESALGERLCDNLTGGEILQLFKSCSMEERRQLVYTMNTYKKSRSAEKRDSVK